MRTWKQIEQMDTLATIFFGGLMMIAAEVLSCPVWLWALGLNDLN